METSEWETGVALNLDWPNLSLGGVCFLARENLRAKIKDWRLKNPRWIGSVLQMRILSGIQPSGALHLGNYFGMMRPAIELQEKGEAYYFLADYHSMTSVFDAVERRKKVSGPDWNYAEIWAFQSPLYRVCTKAKVTSNASYRHGEFKNVLP